MAAGGLECISLVQEEHHNGLKKSAWIDAHKPGTYDAMLRTAENVAQRYGVSREQQDDYAFSSQMRTARAQRDGCFDDEIVPMKTTKRVTDKATGAVSEQEAMLTQDEGNRARHHARRPGQPAAGAGARHHTSPPAMPRSCPTVLPPAS